MKTPPQVPYTRKLSLGSTGHDVIAVKRALSRAGYMEWGEFTPLWGKFAIIACVKFQKVKGLKPTGIYTFATHEALRKTHKKGSRSEWAFDQYAISLMENAATSPEDRVRMKIVDFLNWTILHRGSIAYEQYRPYDPHKCIPFHSSWLADCSQYAKTAYFCAGAKSPDGLPWGSGNTTSFRARGKSIALGAAKIGDMAFYSHPDHVSVLRDFHNGTWYVGELGSDAGPLNVPVYYRSVIDVRTYDLV